MCTERSTVSPAHQGFSGLLRGHDRKLVKVKVSQSCRAARVAKAKSKKREQTGVRSQTRRTTRPGTSVVETPRDNKIF